MVRIGLLDAATATGSGPFRRRSRRRWDLGGVACSLAPPRLAAGSMVAAELVDGDGAMLDAIGVAAGAEEAGAVEAAPPQAVRLSMAAAAIPATERVVR